MYHGGLIQGLEVLVGHLELCLELAVLLVESFDFGIAGILCWNVQRHEVFGQVGSLLMEFQVHQQVVVHRIDDLALAVDEPVFPRGIEGGLVAQHLQELGHLEDDLLLLGLLGVDGALGVQVLENVRKEVAQLECV